MRRIAIVNQKGGVGMTTSAVNLGAALARAGQRVVLFDLDPQGNLGTHLGIEIESGAPSTYGILTGSCDVEGTLRPTAYEGPAASSSVIVPNNPALAGQEFYLQWLLFGDPSGRPIVTTNAAGIVINGL